MIINSLKTVEKMTFNNIVVVVPANVVSGGPEALHHLVQEMNLAGLNASICYFPFDQKFKPPERYAKFNTPVIRFEDCASTLYIFPEVMPMEALRIKKGRAIIWWLSLDNYYERRPDVSLLRNVARYIKRRYKGARPMRGISALRNLVGVSDRRGYVTYSDYLKAFDAERARTGKLPMSHTPSILSMFDPTGNLQTSLGRFTYENTPEGLIVHDVYDFNPISDKATETDKEVTQLLGSVLSPVWAMRQYAGEKIPVGSGRTVRINLGK